MNRGSEHSIRDPYGQPPLVRLARIPGRLVRVALRTYRLRTDPVGYARRIGVQVGAGCRLVEISAATFGAEPYLIRLGDGVGLAGGVRFVTHDGAVTRQRHDHPDIDVVGPIRIGDHAMIGLNSIIMPGVTIGSDVVIAAGSVVVFDIPPRSVAAGAPARVIADIAQYERRALARSTGTAQLSAARKREVLLARFAADLAEPVP